MLGSVSCTVAGVPCLFALNADGIWEVERAGDIPDGALDRTMRQLLYIAETTRPGGPDPITRAADALGGIPYVAPKAPSPGPQATPPTTAPDEGAMPSPPASSPPAASAGDPAAEAAYAEMGRTMRGVPA